MVVRGHRVASGSCGDPRFPDGTIRPQLDALRRSAPGFDEHLGGEAHPGTVNVRLAGPIAWGEPEHRTGPVAWTEHFPPERFLLSRALLDHRGVRRPAWIYRPDPATKPPAHVQAPDVAELLAVFVPELRYGDAVALGRAPGLIAVS